MVYSPANVYKEIKHINIVYLHCIFTLSFPDAGNLVLLFCSYIVYLDLTVILDQYMYM